MSAKNRKFFRKMNAMGLQRRPFLFLVDFEGECPEIIPVEQASREGIFFEIGSRCNYPSASSKKGVPHFERFPVSPGLYQSAFDKVMAHIRRGDTYLLNLTFATPVSCDLALSTIFERTQAKYKLLYKNEFVCFSPETFVRISDGRIRTFPMKGTIDAGLPDAENLLLNDPKELAEHNTIVDLLRNDLSMVSQNVRVNRFRYVEEIRTNYKHLLQVSSEIMGDLDEGYHGRLGDILEVLLPAGSVTGAPKKKTLDIIREVENYRRGYYTGVFGLFDGEKLDSGVMIRFLENTPQGMFFKSGGGITFLSDMEKEYMEMTDKVYVPFI